TPLLDVLAEAGEVDLDVLYAADAPSATAASTQSLRHAQWFPRSARVARLHRILGRPYPITWTIWHSFYFLRPDCMFIWGWDTFATQAAIFWCVARRVPYVLVIDEHGRRIPANGGWGLRHVLVTVVARRAAGVLTTEPAAKKSMLAQGVPRERVRDLPDATDATAALLLDLADSAR